MTMFTTAATPTRERDPRWAWRAMQVCFGAAMIVCALLAMLTIFDLTYAYYYFSVEAANWLERIYAALDLASTIAYAGCIITLMVLTYILVGNAHSRRRQRELTSPTLAVASYLVPVANLFLPPMMMGHLWRAMVSDSPQGRIGLWWTTIIGSGVLLASGGVQTTPEAYVGFVVASYGAAIVAALLTLRIFSALVKGRRRLQEDAFT